MIRFDTKTPGMKKIQKEIDRIEKIATGKQPFKGVELLDVPRVDGDDASNSEILENLYKLGYHFTELDRSEEKEIAESFEEEAERRLQLPGGSAAEIAAASLRKAMDEYAEIVADHIEKGEGVTKDLSASYKDYKNLVAGFIYPIGKFTGQLLRNLSERVTKRLRTR